MSAALVDTGPLVAIFRTSEPRSKHYQGLVHRAGQEHWPLSTTWPCITEASHLLDAPARFALLRWVASGGVSVYHFDQDDLDGMIEAMVRYTDRPRSIMDFADASLVWLAEDTGVTRIMTTDVRDFSRYRLPDGRSFELL